MLILISPAKTLDFETKLPTDQFTLPDMMAESKKLASVLKKKSERDLAYLMSLSDNLATLNKERFAAWDTDFSTENARPAVLAFKGDVYQGLDAYSFTEEDFAYSQNHLRILSGLHGLLRPLDLIRPYRLEMGTALTLNGAKNLYEFWGGKIGGQLKKFMEETHQDTLINLASNEYFKSVKPQTLKGIKVVTPVFKDYKNGQYKVISFYAKKARGLMSAWLIKNRFEDIESIKLFNAEGYEYNDNLSKDLHPTFTRG